MSAIESRVVELKFQADQFTAGIKSSLAQLQQLKEGLKLEGAKQGLDEVNAAAGRFSLESAKSHVAGLGEKFSALQATAFTVLSNIVNRATDAGLQLAKSLTIEPLTAGFQEYETNLNSIQTIMANTGLKGSEGLQTVTGALDELNHYSDNTIYNFSEMARNIGTFTAAGVKLDVSTNAIKGIANLAAVSGSNAEQASGAMYQLSQALAAGKVTLEDWNSVVNAGMGGKVFQDSLIQTARVHGVNVDAIIQKQGSFRASLEKGWITSEILTETLSKFTGDLSAEQLKSMGYSEQQAKEIMEMGTTAVDAATKVKTMSQLVGTLKESLGSGWSKTWQIIFGDFDEAKESFTAASNALGDMIGSASDARNNLLQGWKDMGGRAALIDGIRNAFSALLSILSPIGAAFKQVFPPATAETLMRMTTGFRDLMERLKLGEESAANLKRTFAGLFSIFGILWDLIKAGANMFGDLFGKLTSGSGGLLRFTGNIGDFIVKLRGAIQEGKVFELFFGVLGKILGYPIDVARRLGDALGNIFGRFDAAKAKANLEKVGDKLKPAATVGEAAGSAWDKATSSIDEFLSKVKSAAGAAIDWIVKTGKAIKEAFSGDYGGALFAGLNTGIFATLIVFVKQFFNGFLEFGSVGGIAQGVLDTLDGVTGALKGMQNALNAAALLGIALAIGVLVLSLKSLSGIDADGLTRGSVALVGLLTQLTAITFVFNKMATSGGKMAATAVGLLALAAAVRAFVVSVEALSKLSWDELARGLTGLIALLAALVLATRTMKTNAGGLISTGVGLVILAAGIRVLVESVLPLSKLGWESLATGLVGVGGLLASLALFTRLMAANKAGVLQGAGLLLLAVGIKILSEAVALFAGMSWESLGRGMAGVGAGIAIIAAALNAIPATAILRAIGVSHMAGALQEIVNAIQNMSKMPWGEFGKGLAIMVSALLAIAIAIGFLSSESILSAVAILIVAQSLGKIQEALVKMGGMSWEQIGKAMVALAGSLILIAGALYIMQSGLAGAAALVVASAALALLVPVLIELGAMSWEEILKGLLGLAGIFTVLGVAGFVLGPLVPLIIALAAGIGLLGIAVLATGAGVLAFATGMSILVAGGTAVTSTMVNMVTNLVALIPMAMQKVGEGIISFANVIKNSGPALVEAMVVVLTSILDAVIRTVPKFSEAIDVLVTALVKVMTDSIPKMVEAGYKMIIAILEGIGRNVQRMVTAAADIIVNFLKGIEQNLPRVIDQAIKVVIAFVNGLADGIRNNQNEMNNAGMNLARALVDGVISGIKRFVSGAVNAAVQMAKDMFNAAKEALGINSPSKKFMWIAGHVVGGLVKGLDDNSKRSADAAGRVADGTVSAMQKSFAGLGRMLDKELVDFTPTITPVLNLDGVKEGATELSDILTPRDLDVSTFYRNAKRTADAVESRNNSEDDTPDTPTEPPSFNYTQNNYSPKALPAAEIYRQTKSAISRRRAGAPQA